MLSGYAIAFDFGTKNIGVAVGQHVTRTVRPLMSLKVSHGSIEAKQVELLIKEWNPECIVVGLPLNMDGSEQPFTQKARKFAHWLHAIFGLQIILHDERLSTMEARSFLFETEGYRAFHKNNVHAQSASIILASWLEQFTIS